VDDIASEILALRQIVFFVWVTLNEHKWVISRERRGGSPGPCQDATHNAAIEQHSHGQFRTTSPII